MEEVPASVVQTLVQEVRDEPPEKNREKYILLSETELEEVLSSPDFQVSNIVVAGSGENGSLDIKDFEVVSDDSEDVSSSTSDALSWDTQRVTFVKNQREMWLRFKKSQLSERASDGQDSTETQSQTFSTVESKPKQENQGDAEPSSKAEEEKVDSLEDSFVWVENVPWTPPPTDQQCVPQGYFEQWPSFNVASKLAVVFGYTGAAACFGFGLGSTTALRTLFSRIFRDPRGAATAAVGFALSPTLMLNAAQFVVIGGAIGTVVTAVPVFVIGAGGVFMTATAYHAFIAASRGVQKLRDCVTTVPREQEYEKLHNHLASDECEAP